MEGGRTERFKGDGEKEETLRDDVNDLKSMKNCLKKEEREREMVAE